MKTIKGPVSVSISRSTGGGQADRINIRIDEEQSGAGVNVEFSLEEFAQVVTGLSMTGVRATWQNPERLGLVRQYKTLPIPRLAGEEGPDLEASLAPYETDGWIGQRADLRNHNNRNRGEQDVYRVGFVRWVVANP
jgi:hypothetical protein